MRYLLPDSEGDQERRVEDVKPGTPLADSRARPGCVTQTTKDVRWATVSYRERAGALYILVSQ